MNNLTDLGWDGEWANALARADEAQEGWTAARVAREERELYLLLTEQGELQGRVSGAYLNRALVPSDFPKVGDWVAVTARPAEGAATIHRVLPRRSVVSRKEPFMQTHEQIFAANVDLLIIVVGLDDDFNLRRLERYVAMALTCGIAPVLALNKADLCADIGAAVAGVETVAPGTPVCVVSALDGRGLDALEAQVARGRTVCFMGSSGVGKSTLVNRFLGEDRQDTAVVRDHDSKGRHTTTRRELITLPGGGLVIDSPGIREMQVWGDEEAVDASFKDIEALAAACKFRDCRHAAEPGCAVRAALESGALARDRYAGYLKLQREAARLEVMKAVKARRVERAAARKAQKGPAIDRADRKWLAPWL